jgi:hypothetical protein
VAKRYPSLLGTVLLFNLNYARRLKRAKKYYGTGSNPDVCWGYSIIWLDSNPADAVHCVKAEFKKRPFGGF